LEPNLKGLPWGLQKSYQKEKEVDPFAQLGSPGRNQKSAVP
jgi:hypothetical protein